MQRLAIFLAALMVTLAVGASYLVANLAADYVETKTMRQVTLILTEQGFDWVTVSPDGMIIKVGGAAPTEAARFKALIALKKVINPDRIVDSVVVVDPDDLHPPKFSLELLRNGDGISLIGLIPDATGRDKVLKSVDDIAADTIVTDMLETADYPEPEGWAESITFAMNSLRNLPRSKISVIARQVTITAISDSQDEKARIESDLIANKPDTVVLITHISAPRPVITPFSLRLIKDENGVRFDSCSADTAAARTRILTAAKAIGLKEDTDCTIGLGVPSPRWGEAAALAIKAVDELGGGSLTFADADITLVAPDDLKQVDFDRIVHNLESSLPDVFSVHAILPPKPLLEGRTAASEVLEFLVTKSPEGMVQMHGRLRDERVRSAIDAFAKAQFGGDKVYSTTRVDSSLPEGWPNRILAGLEALSRLYNGSLSVTQNKLELRGVTSDPDAKTEVTQILSERLGERSPYEIFVTYDEALNRKAQLPTPQECVDRINGILAEKQIEFAPGSVKIEGDAIAVADKIAAAMDGCGEVPMEIGGHTDSQGREAMNQTLSQARAEAVLDALLSREVLTSFLSAKGYGEANPIADNDTEDGRRLNRRIEFSLIDAANTADDEAGAETAATDAAKTDGEENTEESTEEGLDQPMEEDPNGTVMEDVDGQD